MGFVQAVKVCWRKSIDFKGRATRSEFWWFGLFQLIALVATVMLGNETLYTIVALVMVLPSVAVSVRRLHDIGKSGWLLLLHLLPFIGGLVLIAFWIRPSQGRPL